MEVLLSEILPNLKKFSFRDSYITGTIKNEGVRFVIRPHWKLEMHYVASSYAEMFLILEIIHNISQINE